MKLYYSKGACSLAVRITIHEIGVPCEYESVDLTTKKTQTGADFFKINPKGYVPALLLDNGHVLTENGAIHVYLADNYDATRLLASENDFDRYLTLEWLNYIGTELHKGCSPLFNSKIPGELKDSLFKPALKNRLNYVENHLKNQNVYLRGQQFTVADSYLFVILSWLKHFDMELSQWPEIERYFNNLKKRESVQRSLSEEGFNG